jgi:hypothetical protein
MLAAPAPSHAAHPAVSPRVLTEHLRLAITHLPVVAHSHAASYDRSAEFGNWIEQGSGCDTRAVVLKAESLKPTTQNSYCTIETGRWYSYYNNTYYLAASSLQVDHTVPVENVWISGGWRWTQGTRVRYDNDLRDSRTLVAADTHDNESKGDRDPTSWLPVDGQCQYVRYWVAVKTRWHLAVTAAEKATLFTLAASCPNTVLTIRQAIVQYR